MLEEIWTRINNAHISPDEIKKELVKFGLLNFQFKNHFIFYYNILGYSVCSELSAEDNYNPASPSDYQTAIKIKANFTIPEQVPPKTQLASSERLTKFLKNNKFERLN